MLGYHRSSRVGLNGGSSTFDDLNGAFGRISVFGLLLLLFIGLLHGDGEVINYEVG